MYADNLALRMGRPKHQERIRSKPAQFAKQLFESGVMASV